MALAIKADRVDQKFNRWTVIGPSFSLPAYNGRLRYALCECCCGYLSVSILAHVVHGKTRGCNECALELTHRSNTTHGKSSTRAYVIWRKMRSRCNDPNNDNWDRYGGRGIAVCERWDASFENFFADMGHPPTAKHTLERKDNDGNYEPNNCCWATRKEQCNNTSRNVKLMYRGKIYTIAQLCEKSGLSKHLVRNRIQNYGWSVEDAVEIPPITRKHVTRNVKC